MDKITQSVFNLKIDNETKNYVFSHSKHNEYKFNDKATVSQLGFLKRLSPILEPIISDDFNWENVLLAGGLVRSLLETKYDENNDSDIDLFVYGTRTEIKNKLDYIHDYINSKTKCYCFYMKKSPVLTYIIPNYKNLQIIAYHPPILSLSKNKCTTKMDVIDSFDMSHCKVGFDGENVVFTEDFISSMKSRETYISEHTKNIQLYRLVKAHNNRFSIVIPKHNVFIRNYYHSYDDIVKEYPEVNTVGKFGAIARTDKIWKMDELSNKFDEIITNKYVVQNLSKDLKISWEEFDNNEKVINLIYEKIAPNVSENDKQNRVVILCQPNGPNKKPSEIEQSTDLMLAVFSFANN